MNMLLLLLVENESYMHGLILTSFFLHLPLSLSSSFLLNVYMISYAQSFCFSLFQMLFYKKFKTSPFFFETL